MFAFNSYSKGWIILKVNGVNNDTLERRHNCLGYINNDFFVGMIQCLMIIKSIKTEL